MRLFDDRLLATSVFWTIKEGASWLRAIGYMYECV